jgi:hypothetical protein
LDRQQFEQLVAPILVAIFGPGIRPLASGHAMVHPGKKGFALSNIPAVARIRHYWVALSDSRLVLVNIGRGPVIGGDPKLERDEPLTGVHLIEAKVGFSGVTVRLRIGEDEIPLHFGRQYKEDGLEIARRLQAG